MSNSDVVHEGWLTKSPPSRRVWKPKWRRRWFALRHSKDLPAQYYLDYYVQKDSPKPKGTIDLEYCEQVDAGLRMQRRNGDGSTTNGSVFSIRTSSRVYHLEADCVKDMEKWVEVICQVCRLISTDDDKYFTRADPVSRVPVAETSTGPYIPISECITGLPMGYKDVDSGIYLVQVTDDNYRHLQRFQTNCNNGLSVLQDTPSKFEFSSYGNKHISPEAFSQSLTISKHNDNSRGESSNNYGNGNRVLMRRTSLPDNPKLHNLPGTPAPPRPPKPSYLTLDTVHKDSFVGPRIHEPFERGVHSQRKDTNSDIIHEDDSSRYQNAYHVSYANTGFVNKRTDDHPNSKYYMFHAPVVNRGLKPSRPRLSSNMSDESKKPKLQYLDLDLMPSNSDSASSQMKSRLALGTSTVYKTVDFLKTEALKMTCIDTEKSRLQMQ